MSKIIEEIDIINSSDYNYDELFDKFVQKLEATPRSRQFAEEIMDAIDFYDVYELYSTLFERYADFLTDSEFAHYKRRFELLFVEVNKE